MGHLPYDKGDGKIAAHYDQSGDDKYPNEDDCEVNLQNSTDVNNVHKSTNCMFPIKAAKAVNCWVFFLSSKLMYMKNKQNKHVLGSLFHLECNKYCSTFTINNKYSLIHSMNIFI